MKLIIYVDGNPRAMGYSRFEFKWSQAHGCFIWKGKELTPEEFNAEAKTAFSRYRDLLYPLARVVNIPKPDPAADLGVVETPKEVTVEEALGVLERLAPHRLKAKPGPKSKETAEVTV